MKKLYKNLVFKGNIGIDNIELRPNEVILPIVGYEGIYSITNLGRVYSHTRIKSDGIILNSKWLKCNKDKKGYGTFCLRKNNIQKTFKCHRLVGLHFLENKEKYAEINHKDGNKLNNIVDNLEWCTRSENIKHGYDNGLLKNNMDAAREKQRKIEPQWEMDILKLDNEGMTHKNIGEIYNISRACVTSFILRYKKKENMPYKSKVKLSQKEKDNIDLLFLQTDKSQSEISEIIKRSKDCVNKYIIKKIWKAKYT